MKNLLLIDANSLIHRAFHALPPLTTPDGQPIGAIYGLAGTLLKILGSNPPDYIAACFDRPEPTFRKEMFSDYKAHRPATAEELISQIVKARELFEKFNIPIFEKSGYEADDLIGSLVNIFKNQPDLKITILTGDLDTLQLITNDRIIVQTFKKGVNDIIVYNEKAVIERYGFKPKHLPDYKGLAGDSSDNIPGVKGVGPKTAAKILSQYKTLENFFQKLEKEPKNPLRSKFLPFKEIALFSKKLATIDASIPLATTLEKLKYSGLPEEKLIKYFSELGFQSLINRLSRQSVQPSTNTPPELSIAGWLLDPDQKDLSFAALGRRFLHKESFSIEELINFINQKIDEYGLRFVFEKIELPLIPILKEMGKTGIKINAQKLNDLKKQAQTELDKLAKKIYESGETVFNINSPKQVSKIIFQKLNLKTVKNKKTGTGQQSTAEQVLFELKNEHPLIPLLLEYRETFKIKSTYLDPLTKLIASDGRLHTHFVQTGTATGRLSSEKPNLQNIPQSSKWAQPLRNVFEAEKGWRLVSFDYSQIELRILAHESQDPKLKEAFFNNLDVHQLTASQIFGVSLDKVTPTMRRMAKTLNFGIIYGMGTKAFAEQSGLNKTDAQKFIKEYFQDFPQIKIWQEKIKAEARTFGFVKNANGRRRWFLQILSGNTRAQAEAERAAINMAIQSLGADIIKMAMIKTSDIIKERGWQEKVKLILSIHDELLFEIRDDMVNLITPVLKESMEKIYKLDVPLKVEIKQGLTWGNLEVF